MAAGDETLKLYRDLLERMIAFRTVSADPAYRKEMIACTRFLEGVFTDAGFKVQIIEGYGNPVVIARYDAGRAETCLVYGHYDVQPAEKSDGWSSDPFTLSEHEGRFFGRGAVDDKGQVLIHIAAVLSLIRERILEYNITFLIEGDEEVGSERLGDLVRDYRELLACDFICISDGEGVGDLPSFDASFRGVFNGRVDVRTARNDLHSGIYGGVARNAAHVVSALAARLVREAPIRTDLQEPLDDALASAPPFDVHAFEAHISGTLTCKPNDAIRKRLEPSLEITALSSGYVGEGYRNAIPATATVKFNVRTAPGQSADRCVQRLEEWIREALRDLPEGSFNIDMEKPVDGILLRGSSYRDKAMGIVRRECGVAYLRPCGGAIPIVLAFNTILQVPQVLLSLGNEDCNMHGIDENISRACAERGVAISREFFAG